MELALSLVIVAAALGAMVRGVDVRAALGAAGLLLALVAGVPEKFLATLLKEAINLKTIGPICASLGYAYVLKATGADREMVRVLLRPLQRAKWLLIPGGCLVGFVTNTAITSQTACAATVGPVLVPLMQAAGFHPLIAAATLVLGCSGGGNLFNPGDADLVAIQQAARAPMTSILNAMFAPLAVGFAVAVAVFMALARRAPREEVKAKEFAPVDFAAPVDWLKAALPPLPVVMIFAALPGWHLLPPLNRAFPDGLPVPLAMAVFGVVALLVARGRVVELLNQFARGAGYAYVHIITLIIAATCFFVGMTAAGLTDKLVRVAAGSDALGTLASGAFPMALGVVSGSGMGPSVAFSWAVLPGLSATNLPAALDLGVFGAIGASWGRTMSPVAAVVIYTGLLVGVTPAQIARRTAPALLAGFVAAFAVLLAR
jgi:C4-dicarboxylate transporter, DcuC family